MKKFFIALTVFWLAIFGMLIIPNEIQRSVPEDYPQILVKTLPIDPNDLLRGEYVILSYEFSRPDRWIPEDEVETEFNKKFKNFFGIEDYNDLDFVPLSSIEKNPVKIFPGMKVYISLKQQIGDIYIPIDISVQKPSQGMFLEGKVYGKNSWRQEVRFGIEKFFVPQGQGKILEQAQRAEKLYARVAVDPESGRALLVGVEEVE
jgi:uncharacterized membrane-anchored protein